MPYRSLSLLLLLFCHLLVGAQPTKANYFRVVPLGVTGGLDESNLSAYLVAPAGSDLYYSLDAGTLYFGIRAAIRNGVFKGSPSQVLRTQIEGYLITHAHLDHVAGLIMNSPADGHKTIYAMAPAIHTLITHYFTWESWANFGDKGQKPALNKYHYQIMYQDSLYPLPPTGMTVQAFPLSHGNIQSTAFLIKSRGRYLLYLGDTGEDSLEKSTDLHTLWEKVTPLLKNNLLKGIFIEASFPDDQPDHLLFGHLTPKFLMKELEDLAALAGAKNLRGLNLIVIHRKPPEDHMATIKKELERENRLKVHLIFPIQGHPFKL